MKTPAKVEHIDSILVNRLARFYDPFSFLFDRSRAELPEDFFDVEPAEFVANSYRPSHKDYDRRRIAYFVDRLRRGAPIEPIEVDNDIPPTRGGPPAWGPPIIIDGHHRACAAILAGRRRVDCEYSGLVDTLEWLKGAGRVAKPPFSY